MYFVVVVLTDDLQILIAAHTHTTYCCHCPQLCFMKNSFHTQPFLQKHAFNINDPTGDMQVKRAQRACMILMKKLSINGKRGPHTVQCLYRLVQTTIGELVVETRQVPDQSVVDHTFHDLTNATRKSNRAVTTWVCALFAWF